MECSFARRSGTKCQFRYDEHPEHWNGKYYCIWHVPIERKRQWNDTQRKEFEGLLADRIRDVASQQGVLDLVGIVSTVPVTLDGLIFSRVDLQHARIASTLSCRRTTVTESIECRKLEVIDNVAFDNATLAAASFVTANFLGPVSFHEVDIGGPSDFDGAVFQAHTEFTGSTFRDRASFQGSIFKAESSFYKAKFLAVALFEDATFEGAAPFDEVRFEKRASFERALFKSYVEFRESTFVGHAIFRAASFHTYVGFRSVSFETDALFGAPDPATRRLPSSSWDGARFLGAATFENREFSTQGNFSNAVFTRAPNFHGCEFHQAMVFPLESAFKERAGSEAAQAYRTLRLAMEKLSARIEVGQFFALEQESLRNTPGRLRRNEWVMSWLYGKLSDYGRNALKPILVLTIAILAFSGVYALIASPVLTFSAGFDLALVWRSIAFSVQQTVQPFWVWREPDRTVLLDSSTPLYVAPIATAQSIASLVLVSLTLLAIRWRFKRE
jgi:uncharacterized protein YjbI with pentapeptide repeats